MTNIALGKKLAERLDLEHMSEGERTAVLERFGILIIESAVGRLLLALTDKKVEELELYLNVHQDIEDVFEYLLNNYPVFEDIVEEEIVALQGEAAAVIS